MPGVHHLVSSLQTNLSATVLFVGCMDGAVLKLGLPKASKSRLHHAFECFFFFSMVFQWLFN